MRKWLFTLALMAPAADFKKDLVFHASFNKSVDADKSAGDGKLYSAPDYKQQAAAKPGLAGTPVVWEKGALRFTKKNTQAVFFKAEGMTPTQGTISFFLQLDPSQDLEPGFVDPLQLTDKAYNDSAIWVDFTKDDQPRHFRLGVFGALKSWNSGDLPPDKNPAFNQRLVIVKQPPFARGKWTHVAITYSKLGTGGGQASLYLDGKLQGTSPSIAEPFEWDPKVAALRLGVNYTGLMDEISVFRRPLTATEIVILGRQSRPSAP
jgi:hypothetical protein